MATTYPLEYELENNTKVVVTREADATYHFTLMPETGATSTFTYEDGKYTKTEWSERLPFEQLDALREFWLKNETML